MSRPIFERSRSSPLIIVKKPPMDPLLMPVDLFVSRGICAVCGERYFWRVGGISSLYAESEEDADDKERALRNWLQYRKKRLCANCVPSGERNYIATHSEGVVYR